MEENASVDNVRGAQSTKGCMAVQAARYEDKAERRFERGVRRRMERLERLGDEALTYYPEKVSARDNENSSPIDGDFDEEFEMSEEEKEPKRVKSSVVSKGKGRTSKFKIAKPRRKEKEINKNRRAISTKGKGKYKTKKRKRAVSTGTVGVYSDPETSLFYEKDFEEQGESTEEVDKIEKEIKTNSNDSKLTLDSTTRHLVNARKLREGIAGRQDRDRDQAEHEMAKQRRLKRRRGSASAADDRIRRSVGFEKYE